MGAAMKIEESTVRLAASHEALQTRTTELSVDSNFRGVLQSQARRLDDASGERERVARMLQSLVDAILAAMQGKQCPENLAAEPALAPTKAAASDSAPRFEWHCRLRESVHEAERTTVAGRGRVCTADGREIAFDFALDMARAYHSESVYEEAGSVVLKDPLVLSFNGQFSELTAERISFDLDADGRPEEIPGLAAGSGFLVFDRNGNGRADDGSELFGAASGNGFADLARYDADHNGWIDEADPVFGQLAIWSGRDFSSLAEQGVGALYTGAVDAPFALKTEGNQLLGQIRAAGLYLSESGEVGHLQQVDLAVAPPPAAPPQPAERQQLAA